MSRDGSRKWRGGHNRKLGDCYDMGSDRTVVAKSVGDGCGGGYQWAPLPACPWLPRDMAQALGWGLELRNFFLLLNFYFFYKFLFQNFMLYFF
jgi:hypothetical protein